MTDYQITCDYCGYTGSWHSSYDGDPVCYKCNDSHNLRITKKDIASGDVFGYYSYQADGNKPKHKK
jgi:hypothetical protein